MLPFNGNICSSIFYSKKLEVIRGVDSKKGSRKLLVVQPPRISPGSMAIFLS